MNTYINSIKSWLGVHPKITQWLWFIALWFGGLITVSCLTYPIKLLIKSI